MDDKWVSISSVNLELDAVRMIAEHVPLMLKLIPINSTSVR